MRVLLTNLALFVILSIVFSGLNGCKGGSGSGSSGGSTGISSIYPPLSSGLAEADFELLDGTKMKISQHKGKVLLLNIWGTWCGPCRAEMPALIAMQEKYGSQGFEVLGLNIGDGSGAPESVEDIKKFAEQMKLNYTIARSPSSSTVQFYAVTKQQVVPQSMLIDREGKLRGVFVGGGGQIIDSIGKNLDKIMSE